MSDNTVKKSKQYLFVGMVPVTVRHGAMHLVPDSLDLNQRAKAIRDQARALHPNGWAVSATRAVEAQLEKERGLNTLF